MSEERIIQMRLSDETLDKLTNHEREQVRQRVDQLDRAITGLLIENPVRLLLQIPIAADNTADVRVVRWPRSVVEFDTLISGLKAARSAFLKSKQPKGSRP